MFNGKKLKQLRIKKGITQEQLGNVIGVSNKMVNFIESGLREPTLKSAYMAAKYLEVSTDDLMFDDDSIFDIFGINEAN